MISLWLAVRNPKNDSTLLSMLFLKISWVAGSKITQIKICNQHIKSRKKFGLTRSSLRDPRAWRGNSVSRLLRRLREERLLFTPMKTKGSSLWITFLSRLRAVRESRPFNAPTPMVRRLFWARSRKVRPLRLRRAAVGTCDKVCSKCYLSKFTLEKTKM